MESLQNEKLYIFDELEFSNNFMVHDFIVLAMAP